MSDTTYTGKSWYDTKLGVTFTVGNYVGTDEDGDKYQLFASDRDYPVIVYAEYLSHMPFKEATA